jgi:hypothetical protein
MTCAPGAGALLLDMRMLLAAGLVLLASACGSSGAKTTTTSPVDAATAWAGGVCLAFTNYKSDLADAGAALKSNPSSRDLYGIFSSAQTATRDLQQTLAAVGPAPAEAKPAQQAIATLKSELAAEVDNIKALVADISNVAEARAAAPKVKAEVESMRSSLAKAGSNLKGVPEGPLRQGFQQAPNCQSLGS